jgi:hypothetical protein
MPRKSLVQKAAHDERMGARRSVLEELFNDFYDDRRNIYKMNFVRGVFFGLGSAIGATVVVGLLVWGLSLFVDIPGIGDTVHNVQKSLESKQK